MLENLLNGFVLILHWPVLLALLGGTLIGYLIGAIPGLGPSLGVALLIPFTFGMDPVVAMVALVALYMAAEYGGAISAILLNTPGTAAAVATAWDGYPMSRQGKAGFALNISIVSSGIGALLSAVLLIWTAVPLSEMALHFGATEYFALALFGLSLVSSLAGKSLARGLLAMLIGLLLACVGMDPVIGMPRFSPMPDFFDGIPLVPALLGLYAVSEVLIMVESGAGVMAAPVKLTGVLGVPLREYRKLTKTLLHSSAIGYVIGVIPGAGASIASLIAYNSAKRSSKEPELFGNGSPEGVAASETANNAAVSGALAPLLALGIPGSATAAILVGALTIQGIQPGPLLFARNPEIPYSIFASLLLGVPLMVIVGLGGARLWAKMAQVPTPILAAMVGATCCVGAYATENSFFPVGVMMVLGVIGYLLRKADIPLAPIVLALVLGPMMETNLRRALVTAQGDYLSLLSHPITLALFALSLASLAMPIIRERFGKKLQAGSPVLDEAGANP